MADYPLPSWLQTRPSDAARTFLEASQAGQRLNLEKQRLAQQQQQSEMEAQTRREIAMQNSLREQQRIEIEKARTAAEVGLKQQSLDLAGQKIALTANAAARKFAAQQQYQQLLEQGMSPDEAALKIGPAAFSSMAGMAGLSKEVYQRQHPFVPTSTEVDGQKLIQLSPQRYAKATVPPSVGPVEAQNVLDPVTKQPIPGMVAVPGERGMITKNRPRVVTAAENELKRLQKIQDKEEETASRYMDLSEEDLKKHPGAAASKKKYLERQKRIDQLQAMVEQGGSAAPAAAKKSKVERANEIAKEHPDWTKQQIIAAVNSEFK